jgi:hypothetical protein
MGNIDNRGRRVIVDNSGASIYGFAFLGAAVYFVQHATGFWDGVVGVIEAIFWPGVILYEVLEMLKM